MKTMKAAAVQWFGWAPWQILGSLGLAFGGSAFFGATIAQATGLSMVGLAVWMTLSAGSGWLALMPALRTFAIRKLDPIVQGCLLSIAAGELILIVGGILNLIHIADAELVSWSAVASSNAVMASVLALRLRTEGVPIWRTLTLWMLALNGVGGLVFWLTFSSLQRWM
jgi:hypothetical protein